MPFGEQDAGWHQLREVTGADTKEKRLAMVQVTASAVSLSQEKEDKTCTTPKQPMVGESPGEGWQLGEDRGQLIYFDLKFQKRINGR